MQFNVSHCPHCTVIYEPINDDYDDDDDDIEQSPLKVDQYIIAVCEQVIIQSGQPPTVLQQLCALPFPYFSDARLMNVLFPTLVSCCYLVVRNREILQQELSCALLANFIEVSFMLPGIDCTNAVLLIFIIMQCLTKVKSAHVVLGAIVE